MNKELEKAIRHFECMRDDNIVVLNSGFGTKKGEHNSLYKNRKMYAELAIEALEKQIPKKINYVKKYYGSPYQCPICEAEQTKIEFMSTDGSEPKEKHSHCWNCGQKLDWSEVE